MAALAVAAALALISAVGLSNCGGGPSSPSTPRPNPGDPNVFTVTSTGVSPKTMTLPPGSQVTFLNNDSRPHEMTSDPHPTHEDCPEINHIGFLSPGEFRQSGNFIQPQSCGFHDHLNDTNSSLRGTIVIQ